MNKKIDILFLFVVVVIVIYKSYLLSLIYPFAILTEDTSSWYEHAKYFSFWSHSPHETYRRLPFGIILLFSTRFASPSNFILIFHTCLFMMSILAFFILTKSLFNSTWLRMGSTLLLLAISIILKKVFYYNFVFMSEASTSFFIFFGAVLALLGFFRLNNFYFLLGYFILGIGAFAKANTLMIAPVWFLFLFYCYRHAVRLRVLILAGVLLVAPNVAYQIRTVYLGGLYGYKLSDYILARSLSLLEDQDIVTENLALNQKLIETLRSYESSYQGFKDSPYDSYMMMRGYKIKDYPTWQELIIKAAGSQLDLDGDSFNRSAYIIAARIVMLHAKSYFKMVMIRYVETFNTFNECAREVFDPARKYSHINVNQFISKDFINIFFKSKEQFPINDSKLSSIAGARFYCSNLSKLQNFFFASSLTLISHLSLIVFTCILFKASSLMFVSSINVKNCLITYIAFISTVIPIHAFTTLIHFTAARHTVIYELLINSSLIILLIVYISIIGHFSLSIYNKIVRQIA